MMKSTTKTAFICQKTLITLIVDTNNAIIDAFRAKLTELTVSKTDHITQGKVTNAIGAKSVKEATQVGGKNTILQAR